MRVTVGEVSPAWASLSLYLSTHPCHNLNLQGAFSLSLDILSFFLYLPIHKPRPDESCNTEVGRGITLNDVTANVKDLNPKVW